MSVHNVNYWTGAWRPDAADADRADDGTARVGEMAPGRIMIPPWFER